MNLRDEFFAVLSALDEAGVKYAVCGGFAVAIHGYPRLTQDIDLLVHPDHVQLARAALGRIGYTVDGGMLELDAGKPSEQRLWRVSKAVDQELVTVDLLLAEGTLSEVWRGREVHALGDRTVCVVSAAGLARMKRAAGRRKDLDDLDQLGLPHEDPDAG